MGVLGHLKKLLSDSVVYGLSNVLSKFIGIFLVPIYTAIFTPHDYGVISIIANSFALISILLVLGMDNSTARWFYDTESKEVRKKTINTWLWFYILVSVVFTVALLLVSNLLSGVLFNHDDNNAYYIKLVAFSLPATALVNVCSNVMRFDRRPIPAVIVTLSQSLLLIGFNIFFVIYLRIGLKGIYYSQLISASVSGVLALCFMNKWLMRPYIDWHKLKAMVIYSLPFVPASIAFWVINLSGTFFINFTKGSIESGLFQIGVSVASGVALFTAAFQQAWMPFAFSILKDPKAKQTYANVFILYVSAMLLVCLGVSMFSKEILIILTNKKYYSAANVASILVYSYFFIGLTYIADLGTAITKQTKPLGFILLMSAILYPILVIAFIPILGKEGAALATCLSQAIVPIYMFFKSQKVYYIPFNFRYGIFLFIITTGLAILSANFPLINNSIYIKIILFLGIGAAVVRIIIKSGKIGIKME